MLVVRAVALQALCFLLISCVTLGKLLNVSEPQLLICEVEQYYQPVRGKVGTEPQFPVSPSRCPLAVGFGSLHAPAGVPGSLAKGLQTEHKPARGKHKGSRQKESKSRRDSLPARLL